MNIDDVRSRIEAIAEREIEDQPPREDLSAPLGEAQQQHELGVGEIEPPAVERRNPA